MKRKIEKVTPKAGTLKHTNQIMRTGKSLTGKLSAFVLVLSLALANMSFVQDDATLKNSVSMNTTDTADKMDSCCAVAKPAVKKNDRNVFRLYNLPSEEMIRKSDSEAYTNLRHSLTENKLKALKYWMTISDRSINSDFLAETTVSMDSYFSSNSADQAIRDQFNGENISVNVEKQSLVGDADMNDVFTAEVAGIPATYQDLTSADADLHNDFLAANTSISFLSAEMISNADAEIHSNIQMEWKEKSFAGTKKAKK